MELTSVKQITLAWRGPFNPIRYHETRDWLPPPRAGVYLWTLHRPEGYAIAWVGQDDGIKGRIFDHAVNTLGGRGSLFLQESMLQGDKLIQRYPPPPECVEKDEWFPHRHHYFTNNFEELSRLAYMNLSAYSVFWATSPELEDARTRKCVEYNLKRRAMNTAYRELFIVNFSRNDYSDEMADEVDTLSETGGSIILGLSSAFSER